MHYTSNSNSLSQDSEKGFQEWKDFIWIFLSFTSPQKKVKTPNSLQGFNT
jgi:hypothetical protein